MLCSLTFTDRKLYEFENGQESKYRIGNQMWLCILAVNLYVLNLHVLQSVVRKVRWAEQAYERQE